MNDTAITVATELVRQSRANVARAQERLTAANAELLVAQRSYAHALGMYTLASAELRRALDSAATELSRGDSSSA